MILITPLPGFHPDFCNCELGTLDDTPISKTLLTIKVGLGIDEMQSQHKVVMNVIDSLTGFHAFLQSIPSLEDDVIILSQNTSIHPLGILDFVALAVNNHSLGKVLNNLLGCVHVLSPI